MRAFLRLVLLSGLVACRSLVDPPLPSGAEPFVPPPVFAAWWAMTEACAGIQAPMAAIQWYMVPGADVINTTGVRDAFGYWSAAGNQIVLAKKAVVDGGSVRHEMLHALTRKAGHSRADFLERCGGIVGCSVECVSDADPPPSPDPTAVTVDPTALEVGVVVSWTLPVTQPDGEHFMLIVTVRNPAVHPVMLRFPPHPGGGAPRSFRYRLLGPTWGTQGGEFAFDAGQAYFRPGEVKLHVFDFVLGAPLQDRTVPPGTYRVDGEFAGQRATLDAVRLEQGDPTMPGST